MENEQTFVMQTSIQNIRQDGIKQVRVKIDNSMDQDGIEGQLYYTGKSWTNEQAFEDACRTFQRWIKQYEDIEVEFVLIK